MNGDEYNGWANYETWNVALWIGNDEGLYSIACDIARDGGDYRAFIEYMAEMEDDGAGKIAHVTPDNIAWDSHRLDRVRLDCMMRELAEEE